MKPKIRTLEQYLIEVLKLPKAAIHAAKMEHGVTKREIGSILVRNGFLKTGDLVEALKAVEIDNLISEERIIQRVPADVIYKNKLKFHAETLVEVYVSTIRNEEEVRSAISQYFPEQEIIFIEADPDGIESYLAKIETIYNSESSALEKLIRDAINRSASDIHMFTRFESYSVQYRVDGALTLVHEGEITEFMQIAAKIKDRGKMDMAEKRKPQDGAFDIDHNGRIVSLRVSVTPSNIGEVIVMRILDPEKNNVKLTELGISNLKALTNGTRRSEGINLVCGETGSGKTTTLCAIIREMDRFGKAIYTAEDPVENPIPFVRQINLNELVGLDFNRALKSFMRMDPDVIMIGEIRDEQAARNAIKAAETGHLVMSTLHTGSILGAINRLRDIGVPLYELKSVLRSVIAQKLIRKVCKACKNHEDKRDDCSYCLGMGYKGRTLISECYYFKNEAELEEIATSKEIRWKTMLEDAIDKMQQGITDADEIIGIFGPDAEEALEKINKKSDT